MTDPALRIKPMVRGTTVYCRGSSTRTTTTQASEIESGGGVACSVFIWCACVFECARLLAGLSDGLVAWLCVWLCVVA